MDKHTNGREAVFDVVLQRTNPRDAQLRALVRDEIQNHIDTAILDGHDPRHLTWKTPLYSVEAHRVVEGDGEGCPIRLNFVEPSGAADRFAGGNSAFWTVNLPDERYTSLEAQLVGVHEIMSAMLAHWSLRWD